MFGNYSAILTVITTFAPLCGFGVAQWWLKASGKLGLASTALMRKSLIFVSLSTSLVFIGLFLWFSFSLDNTTIRISALLLTFVLINTITTELSNSVLQIEGRYFFLSIWQLMQSSLILILALGSLTFFKRTFNEIEIGIFYFLSAVIFSSTATVIIYRFLQRQNQQILSKNIVLKASNLPSTLQILKETAPFGVAGLFYLIYYQLGTVFVRYFEGAEATSYYTIAFNFLSVAIVVPGVIYQKFLLPKLHRWAYHDREKFILSYKYGNYAMLGLGILGFMALYFLAPYFIYWFFGEKYIPAIPIVKIMAINIPIVYVASSAGSLLVTQDHMKTKVYYMGFSALISLIFNPILIYNYGVFGAVYTNILSNLIVLLLYINAVKKRILND